MPFFAPHAAMPTWRFIHMQHHRFTNHDDGNDPDHYTMRGPSWQRPLRWVTVDLFYMVFYLPKLGSRPRQEKVELAIQWLVVGAISVAAIATGHLFEAGRPLLPALQDRGPLPGLGLRLPAAQQPSSQARGGQAQDHAQPHRRRVVDGSGLLYQNYHLVHHLHPLVPFYRYIRVWRRNEEKYLEGDPALSTVMGRPITADEYRQMRELVEHH